MLSRKTMFETLQRSIKCWESLRSLFHPAIRQCPFLLLPTNCLKIIVHAILCNLNDSKIYFRPIGFTNASRRLPSLTLSAIAATWSLAFTVQIPKGCRGQEIPWFIESPNYGCETNRYFAVHAAPSFLSSCPRASYIIREYYTPLTYQIEHQVKTAKLKCF